MSTPYNRPPMRLAFKIITVTLILMSIYLFSMYYIHTPPRRLIFSEYYMTGREGLSITSYWVPSKIIRDQNNSICVVDSALNMVLILKNHNCYSDDKCNEIHFNRYTEKLVIHCPNKPVISINAKPNTLYIVDEKSKLYVCNDIPWGTAERIKFNKKDYYSRSMGIIDSIDGLYEQSSDDSIEYE